MNHLDRDALDRHITGDWGEDSVPDDDDDLELESSEEDEEQEEARGEE